MTKSDDKQTEIDIIPEDWEVARLGDVAEIKLGRTPERKEKKYWEKGEIPWVKIHDLNNSLIYDTSEKISEIAFKEKFKDHFVPKGTLLLSFKLTIGRVGILGIDAVHHEGIASLFLNEEKVNKSFLFYLLQVIDYDAFLDNYVKGRTLNKEKLSIFPIPLPPLSEQQKIATVLSVIQEAIEHQDKIIDAVRKLKKSLMHKLFTEGLNGEEQKETEIGRVPESWDVVRLRDAVDFTKKPRTLNLSEFKKNPFIPMEMIPIEKLYINDYLLKSSNELTSGVYCEKGDILLAKITPSFENGKQGIVENIPYDFAFATTEVYPLKPRNNLLDKLFLFYFLIKSDIREAIAGKMQGTTGRKRVPKEAVENSLIPFPPLPEQQQIAHILSTVDKKIGIEERRKTTLKELFKTMLHKLMSGEIRLKEVEV